MVQHYYKCMIVKLLESNMLITQHELGEMYVSLKEGIQEAQKFLRSAKNLKDAKERAENLNQKTLETELGCVVAEFNAPRSEHMIVNKNNEKPYIRKKPYKEGTTKWLVYLAPDGNRYEVLQEGKKHIIGKLSKSS